MDIYTNTNYYVYAYLRNNGTPYYIGKGKLQRAYSTQHTIKPPKNRSRIVFLEKNLTEVGALALERRYIKWYGKKVDKSGILRNITDGGAGISGYKRTMSEETKRKLSESAKKRKPMSDETKRKISISSAERWRDCNYKKRLSDCKRGELNPMYGKTHDDESRKKIGIASKKRQIKRSPLGRFM